MGALEVRPLHSDEHLSVDGTLLQAWASHASLRRIDGEEDLPPPPLGPGEGIDAPKGGKKHAKGDSCGTQLSIKPHGSHADPADAVFSDGVTILARKPNGPSSTAELPGTGADGQLS